MGRGDGSASAEDMFDMIDFGYIVNDGEIKLGHKVIFKVCEVEVSKDTAEASPLWNAFN